MKEEEEVKRDALLLLESKNSPDVAGVAEWSYRGGALKLKEVKPGRVGGHQ